MNDISERRFRLRCLHYLTTHPLYAALPEPVHSALAEVERFVETARPNGQGPGPARGLMLRDDAGRMSGAWGIIFRALRKWHHANPITSRGYAAAGGGVWWDVAAHAVEVHTPAPVRRQVLARLPSDPCFLPAPPADVRAAVRRACRDAAPIVAAAVAGDATSWHALADWIEDHGEPAALDAAAHLHAAAWHPPGCWVRDSVEGKK